MGRPGRDGYPGGYGYGGVSRGGYGPPPPMGHGYSRGPPGGGGRPGPYARPPQPDYNSPPRGMMGMKGGAYGSNSEPDDTPSMTGHSVRMRGLPFSATSEDVERFLAPLQPVNVQLRRNAVGFL